MQNMSQIDRLKGLKGLISTRWHPKWWNLQVQSRWIKHRAMFVISGTTLILEGLTRLTLISFHQDLVLQGPVRSPDHIFYFTLRDALNFGVQVRREVVERGSRSQGPQKGSFVFPQMLPVHTTALYV